MSTLFTGYSLSWSKDYQKDSLGFDQFGNQVLIEYDSVATKEFDTSNSQVLNGMLGMLDTHGLDTGIYSIIFAVGSSDNRSTQERCNIRLESSAPKFVLFSVDSIWVNTTFRRNSIFITPRRERKLLLSPMIKLVSNTLS